MIQLDFFGNEVVDIEENKFGIPYQGSKSKIAKDIISFLPSGNRLVDLFGGGFAISHCALISEKYSKVYYNEINPLLVELIKKAINGDYNYDKFKPKWVSREDFKNLKEKDGYIKWIWSFSNGGREYLFGADIEPYKKDIHNYIVFGEKNATIQKLGDVDRFVTSDDIHERRLQFKRLERLQQLQQLERLERLQQLEQLQINCGDYREYEYRSGDVVYCDIPYEGTAQYGEFSHKDFYDWAYSRPYQVFFSSYDISDNRFKCVWQKEKINLMAGASGQKISIEKIYTNFKVE